jgi:protein-tyrosine-phosphatase
MTPTIAVLALSVFTSLHQAPSADTSPAVVFVCEHGAAKSLIATAYFNKLAAERGLAARATFRGVDPQDALSVRAVAGLKADGFAIPAEGPTAIAATDVDAATHIFAIGCVLPTGAAQSGKASAWDDVPDDQGYGPMRDAIVRHVRALVDSLR